MLSLGRWSPRRLLLAWIGYWLVLLVVALGPAVVAALPVILDENGHGSINASFGNGVLSLNILRGTTTVWHGEASLLSVALWIGLPPLALWLAWMWRRAREGAAPSPSEVTAPTRVR